MNFLLITAILATFTAISVIAGSQRKRAAEKAALQAGAVVGEDGTIRYEIDGTTVSRSIVAQGQTMGLFGEPVLHVTHSLQVAVALTTSRRFRVQLPPVLRPLPEPPFTHYVKGKRSLFAYLESKDDEKLVRDYIANLSPQLERILRHGFGLGTTIDLEPTPSGCAIRLSYVGVANDVHKLRRINALNADCVQLAKALRVPVGQ